MFIETTHIQKLGDTLKFLCNDITCYPVIDKLIIDIEAKYISTYEGVHYYKEYPNLYSLDTLMEDLLSYCKSKNKNLVRVLLLMKYYSLYHKAINSFVNFLDTIKENYETYPFDQSLKNGRATLQLAAQIMRFQNNEIAELNHLCKYENDFKIKDLSLIKDYAYIVGKDALPYDIEIDSRGIVSATNKGDSRKLYRGIENANMNKPIPIQHILLVKLMDEACKRYTDPNKRFDYIVKSFKALFKIK